MVIPGPGVARLGSLVETMPNRSPFGSQANEVTVSTYRQAAHRSTSARRTTGSKVSRTERRGVLKGKEGKKRTLQLDDLDGVILLSHSEDLEVAERRLLGLGVSVDLDAEEVSLVLPVELGLRVRVRRARETIGNRDEG
jgi:hypothetical protein